jgi:uncharacterized protein
VTRHEKGLFVVLLPSLECNLNCDYCFQSHPPGRWAVGETLRVLDEVVDLAGFLGARHVRLHWQGGEPLMMGMPYWSRVLEEARRRADAAGISLSQSMQTNLTLYRSQAAPLIHQYLGGRLGTSFEGTGARHYPGDEGGLRFRRIWMRAMSRAREDGVEVGVLSLISEDALAQGATGFLERMYALGVRGMRLGLPFQQDSRPARGHWLDAGRAGRFLVEAYEWWADHGRDVHLHLKPMTWIEQMFASGTPTEPGLCIFARNCTDVGLCVTPAGEVTLCDSFACSDALPSYGNVFRQPLRQIYGGWGRGEARARCGALVAAECMECRYLPLCYGGCLVRSRPATSEGKARYHYCEAYRQLFSTVERRLVEGPHAKGRASLPSPSIAGSWPRV